MPEDKANQPTREPPAPAGKLEGQPPPSREWVTTELVHGSRDQENNILFGHEQ